jgi:hypothetical protein
MTRSFYSIDAIYVTVTSLRALAIDFGGMKRGDWRELPGLPNIPRKKDSPPQA